FGITAIVSIGLIIAGWRMSDFIPVYDPPTWGRNVTFLLLLFAFLCLGIFLFRGSLRQRLRSPLSIGVVLWGVGHLFANGDRASLILFSGMIMYGLTHLVIAARSGYRPSPEVRNGHDVLSVLAGATLYGLMIQLHDVIIGVPALQLI
ncbi:MAG: NnrU family protein, partial [Aestuariivirgaceae bacterium]